MRSDDPVRTDSGGHSSGHHGHRTVVDGQTGSQSQTYSLTSTVPSPALTLVPQARQVAPGQIIDHRYRVEKVNGSGAMGRWSPFPGGRHAVSGDGAPGRSGHGRALAAARKAAAARGRRVGEPGVQWPRRRACARAGAPRPEAEHAAAIRGSRAHGLRGPALKLAQRATKPFAGVEARRQAYSRPARRCGLWDRPRSRMSSPASRRSARFVALNGRGKLPGLLAPARGLLGVWVLPGLQQLGLQRARRAVGSRGRARVRSRGRR